MGTAHGRIRIEYEGDGFEQAVQGFRNIRDEAAETDSSIVGVTKTLGGFILQMTKAVAVMPGMVAGLGAVISTVGAAGIALGAFGLAVKNQFSQISDSSKAADDLAKAEIDAANKSQVAAKLTASGHALAEKATKAAESAQLKLIQSQTAYQNQVKGMPAATAATALEFSRLKLSFEAWSNSLAPETMPIFTRGLLLIRQNLPALTPMVKVVAQVLSDFMTQLEEGASSGGLYRFSDRVAAIASTTLPNLINTVKNIAVGIAGLFGGLNKNGTDLSATLERVTGRFAEWGQSLPNDPGFARFMDQMNQGGGQMMSILGDLILIVQNLIIAFGPFAGATLIIVQAMAQFVQAIPVPVLRVLIGLIIAANVALKVYAATQAIVTAATKAWAIAQRLLNSAFLANPITLIIVGIIALVAAIVILWKRSETFRNIVIGVWNAVKNAVVGAVKFVVNFVRNNWRLLIAIILGPLGIVIGLVTKYWDQIKNAISSAVNFVINFVRNNWRTIITILGGPLGLAVALVTKYWTQISNFISKVTGAIVRVVTGFVNRVLSDIRKVVGIVSTIIGIFNQFNQAIGSRLRSALSTIAQFPGRVIGFFRNAGSWLWNAGKNIIQGLINGIVSMFNRLRDTLGSVTRVIPSWKGPPSVDRKLLTDNGRLIMQSLIRGFEDQLPKVQAALSMVTNHMISTTGAAMSPAIQYLPNGLAYTPQGQTVNNTTHNGNMEELLAGLVIALRQAGVGQVVLDGRVISDTVGRIQGRITSHQRRTR